MNCAKCNVKMIEKEEINPHGVSYKYFQCPKGGEELLNMQQLHEVAEKYREMKRYKAKLSKWGSSIAVRIPKELLKEFHLKANEIVSLIPEKNAIKIMSK